MGSIPTASTIIEGNPEGFPSSPPQEVPAMATVIVRGVAASLATHVAIGPHQLVADEPIEAGGHGTGPNPYDLLLAALGT